MSHKIVVQCEIRNKAILKDTLKQLGHNFKEVDQDVIEMTRAYHPISINTKTGATSLDHMNSGELEDIKGMYAVNLMKDQGIREGNQVTEEINAEGDIVIRYL
jgi:hypothetical protein